MKDFSRTRLTITLLCIYLFLLVISIVGGEIYFRLAYYPPWLEGFKGELINQSVPLDTIPLNSRGLRDDEYDNPKTENIYRILFLGDSYTFGLGVRRRDDLFVEIFERLLNENSILGPTKQLEVMNGGLPAMISDGWLTLLRSELNIFHPDKVIVVFSFRGGCKNADMNEIFVKTDLDIMYRNKNIWLWKHSYLFRFIKNYIDMREISKTNIKAFNTWYIGPPEHTNEWVNAKKNLIIMRDLCREHNISFHLVILPTLFELNDNFPFKQILKVIIEFVEKNNIDYFSLFNTFKGMDASSLWVSKYDQHLNIKAHAIVARALFEYFSLKIRNSTHTETFLQKEESNSRK
jgi:hypothetical protein